MTRIRIATRAVLVALAFAAPVFADAPIGGADQQYENFESSSPTIRDRFTHLEWERPASPYPAVKSFAQAQGACTGGMRLPSLKELLTIVDETPHEEYDQVKGILVPRSIDQNAFSDTPDEYFWTSSMSGTDAWVVNFKDGTTAAVNPPNTNARVRCVRSF